MSFPQMKKRMDTINKILGFFLVVIIVTGCIPLQTQTIKKAEQIKNNRHLFFSIAEINCVFSLENIFLIIEMSLFCNDC